MKSVVRTILVTIFSILLLSWLIPQVSVANTVTLILAGVVLALLNLTLRPLLKVLFLPINIITLGIFGWVINVFILFLATWLVPGFAIQEITILGYTMNQFFSLTFVAVLLSVFSSFLGGLL
ncbi:phage holin family protein [Candidatus Woesebacteria bacterium]|nr:phage holin family protein [Candidatus Woesebacteria bacterium]MCD8507222.1 phage holin family protein [Candidatus Woesebacteria bacterium]MCD8526702.1 phage holin family protein [Candidatus Woesebacteria bacterium]MCD8546554.1 phage holin family protein [Candidatus Woesebacteria bacterium]